MKNHFENKLLATFIMAGISWASLSSASEVTGTLRNGPPRPGDVQPSQSQMQTNAPANQPSFVEILKEPAADEENNAVPLAIKAAIISVLIAEILILAWLHVAKKRKRQLTHLK